MLAPPVFVNTHLQGVQAVGALCEPLPDEVMQSLNQCNVQLKTTWDSNDEEVEQ